MSKSLRDIKFKDLIFVILYGGLISILLGIVIGYIDYFISNAIGWSFGFLMFFMSSQFIGNTVRKQYETPHIVYTIITGVFLALQALIVYTLPGILYTVSEGYFDISIIFDIRIYLNYFILITFNYIGFNYILSLLFIAVGVYVGVRRTY